ncbi:MAG: Crp/Fnr family transcriptional regulator [Vitreimonas sp.]
MSAVQFSTNALLARLSADDLALLSPHLERIDLPLKRDLEHRHQAIEHVYFIERGIASVVANGVGPAGVEVGLIGREGMSAIALLMGSDLAPHHIYMQAAGDGLRAPARAFSNAAGASASLRQTLLKFAHVFSVQTAYTALANARNKIEERLARWLLMADDRLDTEELPLTHEFLAIMLGVRRPGVTDALHVLEAAGLIRAQRGVVVILNRAGLEKKSNGCYGPPEAEMRRLFS